jgi:hypothetical protein
LFLGKVILADVTSGNVTSWLQSLACSPKSWNLYRSSIGAFFNWAANEPRFWVRSSPLSKAQRYVTHPSRGESSPNQRTPGFDYSLSSMRNCSIFPSVRSYSATWSCRCR